MDKFKNTLAENEVFADEGAYNMAWVDLHHSIEEGDLKEVKKILRDLRIRTLKRVEMPKSIKIPSKINLGTKPTLYWNALHVAIYHGQVEIVKYLMENVSINLRTAIVVTETENEEVLNHVETPTGALELSLMAQNDPEFEVFSYIWTEQNILWNKYHFDFLITRMG